MMFHRVPYAAIERAAKVRPDGWLDVVLTIGTREGDIVQFTDEEYHFLTDRCGPLTGSRGLGDAVARVAKPIARAVDAMAGTRLAGCRGCGRRQDDWNKAFPSKPALTADAL